MWVFNRLSSNLCSTETESYVVCIQSRRSHRKQHFVIIAGRLTRRSLDLGGERRERKRTNKQEFNLITRNTSGLENKVLSLVPSLPVADVVHLFAWNVVSTLAGSRNLPVLPSPPISFSFLPAPLRRGLSFRESFTIKWTNHSWRWARYLATFTIGLTVLLECNADQYHVSRTLDRVNRVQVAA